MKHYPWMILLIFGLMITASCDEKDNTKPNPDMLQLQHVKIGGQQLEANQTTDNIPVNKPILISFVKKLDTTTVAQNISLSDNEHEIDGSFNYLDDNETVSFIPNDSLDYYKTYALEIQEGIKGANNESFPGISYDFKTQKGKLKIESITLNDKNFEAFEYIQDIDFEVSIEVDFNRLLQQNDLSEAVYLSTGGNIADIGYSLSEDKKTLKVDNTSPLDYYRPYTFRLRDELAGNSGWTFDGFENSFFTRLDSTNKFPVITDEELLTKIQQQTFTYFWDYAHPVSGLARERKGSGNTVTTGGSGFGVMAIIAGVERNFITRQEGIQRMEKIVNFLENADRFHGAWPHWMNGNTGEVIPFSPKDDGADLVETAFMIQGLLTFRQYLNPTDPDEQELIDKITALWHEVEWDWFTNDEEALYWHWSPNYNFEMNMKIRGHNETQITYILAASSPTHPIEASVYHNGYAINGGIVNGNEYYGYTLPMGQALGGPLFFTHYSYLGLDPRNLEDDYGNYWQQNTRHALIHQAYCADNPKNYVGYNAKCWGLTASDNHEGYSAHSPTNDLGVITPTAAVASLPYTPEKSMEAIHHFYYKLGDRLWGEHGFYDAFNVTENWWANSYISIDQGPIVLMIENHRSQLLWELFMADTEIQAGLNTLGFSY